MQHLKVILELSNEIEKDVEKNGIKYRSLLSIIEENNYIINNFKKMVVILYRIKENIPVILIRETGFGKATLIIKLNQILNNGKTNVEIINIHQGINDEILYKFMEKIETIKQKRKKMKNYGFFSMI